MAQLISEVDRPVVGEKYLVPCLHITGSLYDQVNKNAAALLEDRNGSISDILPVLSSLENRLGVVYANGHDLKCAEGDRYRIFMPIHLPLHDDTEVNFPWLHYHVDPRWVKSSSIFDAHARSTNGYVYLSDFQTGYPVTGDRTTFKNGIHMKELVLQKTAVSPLEVQSNNPLWVKMEKRVGSCHKLKPGGICPHKGISLKGHSYDGGKTAICPGHGLHWDLETGEMIPRHSRDDSLGTPFVFDFQAPTYG